MQEPGFSVLVLIARVFLSAVFLVSGIHKAFWYTKATREFERASVPLFQVTLPATIALHLTAASCVLSGFFSSAAALSLALFTLAATYWVFPFWKHTGSARLEQSRVALANLGLTGGLLLLAATGPGRFVLF